MEYTRRSFLTGSLLFASVLGVNAQSQKREDDKQKSDPFGPSNPPEQKKLLVDKEGREYRVCPQCGGNMYREGRMWICEVCGYSYVE